MKLSTRSKEYSANNRPNYANIITTIAVALFVMFFTLISGQLRALDVRIRALEIRVAEIATRLGIEQSGLTDSQKPPARPPGPSRLDDPLLAGPE